MRGSPSYVSATLLIETFVQAATAVEEEKRRKSGEKKKEKGKENHYYEVDTESEPESVGKTQTIIMTATSPC